MLTDSPPLTNLAGVQLALGRGEQARLNLERAADNYQRTLGSEHPHTLVAMSQLASAQAATGDLFGARKSHELVVARARSRLGPRHPDTAAMIVAWAKTVAHLGEIGFARTPPARSHRRARVDGRRRACVDGRRAFRAHGFRGKRAPARSAWWRNTALSLPNGAHLGRWVSSSENPACAPTGGASATRMTCCCDDALIGSCCRAAAAIAAVCASIAAMWVGRGAYVQMTRVIARHA